MVFQKQIQKYMVEIQTENKFLIPLGDTSDLNKILIKSIEKTFDSKKILDHLVENMREGDAVRIYTETKSHLTKSIFVLMPNLTIKDFYAKLNEIEDVSTITDEQIKSLNDIVSFDDLMNKRTNDFLQTFGVQSPVN